ncbi:MAG: alpha/beta fold hydrolase [Acidimicrobiales bacterium]
MRRPSAKLRGAGEPADDAHAGALHVERSGTGPSIVLVHGFTQSSRIWADIAGGLDDSHEVLAPDLPGHGRSPSATGDLAAAADRLAESCGKGTYVGYSLGGRICLHLALRRPILVERLVLVATTAGIDDLGERTTRRQADDALADRIARGGDDGIPAFIDEWLESPLFSHLSDREANREARLGNRADGLASSLRCLGVGTQLPVWEQVRAIRMPVLVLAGEKDPKFVALGERLASAIGPNALFVLVPNSGHAVPFEQPDAFTGLVRSFAAGDIWPPPPPPADPDADS